MTGALTPIAPKLALLIPRLSSPFDGEKLATLAAIERMLMARGLDFNDFAEAISRPEPAPRIVLRDGQQPPPAEPFRGDAYRPDPNGLRRDKERVQWLLLAPETLRAHEIEFLRSICGRLSGGRPLTFRQTGGRPLTFRQNEWLVAIYARASREYARCLPFSTPPSRSPASAGPCSRSTPTRSRLPVAASTTPPATRPPSETGRQEPRRWPGHPDGGSFRPVVPRRGHREGEPCHRRGHAVGRGSARHLGGPLRPTASDP